MNRKTHLDMNVNLLQTNNRHISATHLAIIGVMRKRM